MVEELLTNGVRNIVIDFSKAYVSNSFMDEFLGVLILRHGPDVLTRLTLRNCSEDVKTMAAFITSVRSQDFGTKKTA
jgi:hypothetical protein